MNKNRLKTRFGPETRFEVQPAPPAPYRQLQENELDKLKEQLLRAKLNLVEQMELTAYVRRAANEAAALAWVTPYPTLVFPALFDEKAETALLQAQKQERIRERSALLLAV
ncbi:MAG TPA: hypothetical protein VH255_03630 [Verrucomicrobiae bacterium]|jgi:hypothetical protein|nr:hypothetical protein [Verrucomicrobiae bacterium]